MMVGEEEFKKFERFRRANKIDILDCRKAMKGTGLDIDQYNFIVRNFGDLVDKYYLQCEECRNYEFPSEWTYLAAGFNGIEEGDKDDVRKVECIHCQHKQ